MKTFLKRNQRKAKALLKDYKATNKWDIFPSFYFERCLSTPEFVSMYLNELLTLFTCHLILKI